jgi:hypothetical protein
MRSVAPSRSFWGACTLVIIALGLLSRAVPTGLILWDKYLGDALYAAMVYALLRMMWPARTAAGGAAAIMLAIECFQLTGIPAAMVGSDSRWVRIAGRLLGTQFGFTDLLAYAFGIAALFAVDGEKK